MDLTDLRREMDETDRALLALFARRMALSGAIARVKQEAHLPVLDPRREEEKLRRAEEADRLIDQLTMQLLCDPSQPPVINTFLTGSITNQGTITGDVI